MQCVDPVVVLGTRHYVMQRNWVESDVDLRGISSVAVLDNGLVAGLFRTAPHVRLFDAHGRLAAQWEIPAIVCPHHITALADGGTVTDLTAIGYLAWMRMARSRVRAMPVGHNG